jgi:hypothetical protein
VRAFGIAIALAIGSTHAVRADDGDIEIADPYDLQVHGFVSQGFLATTDNNYLADSEGGSLEFFEAGINFSKQLTDRLRIGLQLFSRDLGPIGDYAVKLDWGYLDYQFHERFGIRAGRIKLPYGLYNDSSDIDAAHPMVLLPQSIYSLTSRDFLLAQTGLEAYGRFRSDDAGTLDYQLAVGSIFVDYEPASAAGYILELEIPYVVAGRVIWETPVEGLRVALSGEALRLDSTLLFAGSMTPLTIGIDALLGVASAEYSASAFTFALEYSLWRLDNSTSDPMVFPDETTVSERGYVLAAYRPRPWVQGYGYYSLYYPDVEDTDGRDARQHDAALGARFDINPNWILKVEGHDMRGTAALSPSLNDNIPLDQLVNRWWVLVAKTTAYF